MHDFILFDSYFEVDFNNRNKYIINVYESLFYLIIFSLLLTVIGR